MKTSRRSTETLLRHCAPEVVQTLSSFQETPVGATPAALLLGRVLSAKDLRPEDKYPNRVRERTIDKLIICCAAGNSGAALAISPEKRCCVSSKPPLNVLCQWNLTSQVRSVTVEDYECRKTPRVYQLSFYCHSNQRSMDFWQKSTLQ